MYKTLELSKNIKLIITDFDGVFTDGGVWVDNNSAMTKKISYKDIMGLSVAVKNGFKIAIVSGDKSNIIDLLAQRFSISEIYQDIRDKARVVADLLEKYKLNAQEAVYIGDDINDIEAMKLTGYRVAPPNAHYRVKQLEGVQITEAAGADGVFREVIDNLLEI